MYALYCEGRLGEPPTPPFLLSLVYLSAARGESLSRVL